MYRKLKTGPENQFCGTVKIPVAAAPRCTGSGCKHALHAPKLAAENAATRKDCRIAFSYWKRKQSLCPLTLFCTKNLQS